MNDKTGTSRRLTTKLFLTLGLLLGSLLCIGSAGLWTWLQLETPYRGYQADSLFVDVARGESVATIGAQLERYGIVSSSLLFRIYMRIFESSSQLKAGEYLFDRPLSMSAVVNILKEGRVYYHRVTIPEGSELTQVAEIFASAGFGEIDTLRQLMSQSNPVADLDTEAENLEGYLFPDTYFLTRGTTEGEIIRQMVENFRALWTQELQARAHEIGMNVREVVTLASLIEKEVKVAEERKLVSAVFHNRLSRNMNLACDPTVIYAVKLQKEYDGVINQSDLLLDSPYNTYLYPGLPPGPIANPGRNSIDAALHPANSDHLFFVSKNDGSHVFSNTYREHNRAVQRYQR